jgi:hypothetical protein
MFNQNRIYRLFQLINFLKARPAKSIRSIEAFLETSERTAYRYLDLLKDLGFQEHKTDNTPHKLKRVRIKLYNYQLNQLFAKPLIPAGLLSTVSLYVFSKLSFRFIFC